MQEEITRNLNITSENKYDDAHSCSLQKSRKRMKHWAVADHISKALTSQVLR